MVVFDGSSYECIKPGNEGIQPNIPTYSPSVTIHTESLDSETAKACADLYNTAQFGAHDRIDPTHPNYSKFGGVHMGRKPEWYQEQLKRPGAHLVEVTIDGTHVAHSLFFTDFDNFPNFAADVLWMNEMAGVEKLAYGYLTIVSHEYRGLGIAKLLAGTRKEILQKNAVTVLATEVHALPQPNIPSFIFHQNQGAICIGRIGEHTIPSDTGDGTVLYAQYATAMDGYEIRCQGRGEFEVVDKRH